MNSYPNIDCKQCTESKLGCVHSAHTQNPCRAHTVRAVPRSWALLRAQQAGRARSCAPVATQSLVTTPNFNRPGRDLKLMSRPAFALSTETPLSRPKTLVATPNHHKAARTMSRHHSGQSRSRPQNGVTTPFLLPSPKPGRDTKTRSRPS